MRGPATRREFLAAIPALVTAACGRARRHSSKPFPPRSASTAALPPPSTAVTATSAASPVGPAGFVRRGPSDRRVVALTFHGSGEIALLEELLAVVASHRAPVTIFAVGQWLDANPGVVRRLLDAGHELANHTYTHPSLGRLSGDRVRTEITRCGDALARHGGSPGLWFRPSAVEVPGQTILTAAASAGYSTVVGYDVDPRDYQDPGSEAIRARTAHGLHPGAIVSLHTGHRGTVDALAGILADATVHGLRPVTVSELLQP